MTGDRIGRRLAWAKALLIVCLLLGGCGGATQNSGGTSPSASSAANAASSASSAASSAANATSSSAPGGPSVPAALSPQTSVASRAASAPSLTALTLPTPTPALAQMTSPSGGSTIATTTTFTWSAGAGNTAYWLTVGSTLGGQDVLNASEATATSATVSNLPAGPVYVRLWSLCAGNWCYIDYAYTTGNWALAQMTSPANGAHLSAPVTFTWSAGSGNSEYWLTVGTSPGGSDLFNASCGTATSATLNSLSSKPLYVRLWSRSGASWGSRDYTYTTGAWTLAQLTSPANGATLAAASTTFSWSGGAGNSDVWLSVGTTVGGRDLFDGDEGSATSQTVSGLPAGPIYLRLWSLGGGTWGYVDYAFTTGAWVAATMTTPTNGASLGPTTTFSWSSGNDNLEYWLVVGTTAGGHEIFNATEGTATSATLSGLPAGPLYVQLWSRSGSAWSKHEYTYTVGAWTLARITSPAAGAVVSSPTTFNWSAGVGNAQYWLQLGTSPGAADIFNAGLGTTLSATVGNLPSGPIYARLWSSSGGSWLYVDSAYSTAAWVPAQMTSPTNGATVSAASTTFNWSAGSGNSQFWLSIGTAAGAHDLVNLSEGTAISATVSGMPAGPLYVGLWSQNGGRWQASYSTYLAVTAAPSPSPSPSPSPGASPSPSVSPSPSPGASPSPSPGTSPSPALPALPDQAGAFPVPSQIFPVNDDWNTDISGYPVLPLSSTYITSIGASVSMHPDFGGPYNGAPNGIPYIVVAGTQPLIPIDFMWYASDSDPGPYPFPSNAPIEGINPGSVPPLAGVGDQHTIVLDRDHMKLYETWLTNPPGNPTSNWATDAHWSAANGAVWDLTRRVSGQRPLHWTSADAAGLPIFPGLARYDEIVTAGVLTHALRVTVNSSQNAFYAPASHQAGNANASLPPMGLRIRLKASFVISPTLPSEVKVILTGLKKYGMIVADNGSSWYLSGAPDSRWNDSNLHALNVVKGSDFECVDTGATLQY